MKEMHGINTHKLLAPFIFIGLIWVYDQWSNTTAWVYLALQSGYSLSWVARSIFLGDSFNRKASVGKVIATFLFLALYYVPFFLLVSLDIQVNGPHLAVCIFIFLIGFVLVFLSDLQKSIMLSLKPQQLITNGLFKKCRNTNYLGELLLYLGLFSLAPHYITYLVLIIAVTAVWVPNMKSKDKSLSRYPEFSDYKKTSYFWIPFVY